MDTKNRLGSLEIGSSFYKTRISSKFLNRKTYQPKNQLIIESFIPGTIIDILIKEGDYIKKGNTLMIIDAMKMKNILRSDTDGKVKTVMVGIGEKVSRGMVLLELE